MKYVNNLTKIFFTLSEYGSALASLNSYSPEGVMVPINGNPRIVTDFLSKTSKEINTILKDFAIEHIGNLSDSKYFLSAWLDKDYNLHIDVCTSHLDSQEAIYVAMTRGISELIINGNLLEIPSPQKTGTDFQKKTYAHLTAQKLSI